MPRAATAHVLDSGDLFPCLGFETVGGGKMRLPDALIGAWSVILFYRGDWCRQDRQQLLDYQIRTQLFAALDIRVVAASSESLENAASTVKDLRITYPIGYGLDAKEISHLVGAYYDDTAEPPYLQATGFLLQPSGKVFNAVYSSRSIGRLTALEVASLVELIRSREVK